jgi:hypothetical protein
MHVQTASPCRGGRRQRRRASHRSRTERSVRGGRGPRAPLSRVAPGSHRRRGAGNRCNVRLPVAQPHGWGRRHRSGVIRLAFTRDVLDWHVRQHLARYEAVLIQMDAHVVGLLPETACASRTGGAPLPAEADRPVVSSQLTGMTLAGAAEFELAVGSSLVFDPLLVVRV